MHVQRQAPISSGIDPGRSESAAPRSRARVQLGFTLGLAMCVGMLTVFALGVLAPFLTADLGMSAGTVGALSGMLFLAAALLSPKVGSLVDRWGARPLLMVLFASVAVAWVALAAAPNPALLFPPIALAGLGMALANPVTTRLAQRDGGDHMRLIGIAQAGSPLGSVLVGLALPAAALALGWRTAVLAMCALCVLGLLNARTFEGSTPELTATTGTQAAPKAYWLSTYSLLMNSSSTAAIVYLPLFAYQQLGWSEQVGGLIAAVVGVVSMLGRLLWPRLLRNPSAIPWTFEVLAGTAAASTLLVLLAGTGKSALLLWIGVTGLAASAMSWVSVVMSAITIEADSAHTGRVAGVVMRYGYLGAAAGPALFGQIVEITGSWATAWTSALAIFFVTLLGTAAWHRRRIAGVP